MLEIAFFSLKIRRTNGCFNRQRIFLLVLVLVPFLPFSWFAGSLKCASANSPSISQLIVCNVLSKCTSKRSSNSNFESPPSTPTQGTQELPRPRSLARLPLPVASLLFHVDEHDGRHQGGQAQSERSKLIFEHRSIKRKLTIFSYSC